MTPAELLREVLRGRLLIVGEYRGSQAEKTGYVDRKTGQAIHYILALHLLECACRGNLDRAIIYERLPEIIETPEEATFHYLKGRPYVFFLSSLKNDRGQVICSMGDRGPELVEVEEGSAGPVGAPEAHL